MEPVFETVDEITELIFELVFILEECIVEAVAGSPIANELVLNKLIVYLILSTIGFLSSGEVIKLGIF